jgi:quercetin 2,3-dioxygenase
MKRLLGIQGNDQGHWVGNGFPVRTLFFYQQLGKEMSPFLMLDLAGPAEFPPTTERKGVGTHPHRGFETVTIVYDGEVSHKDSTGQGGTIGPGDVQWMTAGAGILHQEFHSDAFAKQGGVLQMVQLWVNLPAKHKMTAPGYQPILSESIPEIELSNSSGSFRVIAGEYEGPSGSCKNLHTHECV